MNRQNSPTNGAAFNVQSLIDEYFNNTRNDSLCTSFRKGGFFYSCYGRKGLVFFAIALLSDIAAIVLWVSSLQSPTPQSLLAISSFAAVIAAICAHLMEKTYNSENEKQWRENRTDFKDNLAEKLLIEHGVQSTQKLDYVIWASVVELGKCASETSKGFSYASTVLVGIGGIIVGVIATILTSSNTFILLEICVAVFVILPLWVLFHILWLFFPLLSKRHAREKACREFLDYLIRRQIDNSPQNA